MPSTCPACPGQLIPVETTGHYGARMTVRTCVECRGFWVEAQAPKALAQEAVATLEGDADLGAITAGPRTGTRLCPACEIALKEVKGGRLPEGLHVDRCRSCHGLWFDRGELLVYKSALEARRNQQRHDAQEEMRGSRRRAHKLQGKNQGHWANDPMLSSHPSAVARRLLGLVEW